MEEILYISKKSLSVEKVLLSKGLLTGEFPFTTTRISNGHICLWDYHRRRLEKTISHLYGAELVEETLALIEMALDKTLIEANKVASAYLRITLFKDGDGDLVFFLWVMEKMPEKNILKLKAIKNDHYSGQPLFIKMSDYSYTFSQREIAKKSGLDDILFFNDQDEILDLSTSSLVLEKEGVFYFSELVPGILDGVTRGAFQNFLAEKNLRFVENKILYSQLGDFDCAFALNSFSAVRNISLIDEFEYNVGKYTNLLSEFDLFFRGKSYE